MGRLKKQSLILSLLLITFLSLLSYATLIPSLGFYNEDFFFGYVAHFYGIEGILKALAVDRPFNGYLLALYYSLLRDNVFFWHFFIFLVRLLGGYALFFLLKKIWPDKLLVVTSITILFLLYPGFLQQPLPLGYGVWITTLTIWVLSLAFTVLALRTTNKIKFIFFILISIVIQINSFLQLEFFIGMEALRLLIITYILQKKISFKTIKKTLLYWSPYIIALLLFILWRIFIFKSTREVTDINWVVKTFYFNPAWITKIPLEIIQGFAQSIIFSYFIPSIINFIRIPLHYAVVSIIFGVTSGILAYFVFKKIKEDNYNHKTFGKQLFLIGLVSVLIGLITIIISGRVVRVYYAHDRYTLPLIIGVCFIIVGFLLFKIPQAIHKWILITLISLSVTSNLMNGFYRVDNWQKQKNLWWQLHWRAPQIKDNAMLILDFPPIENNNIFKNIINKTRWYQFYWVDYQVWTPGSFFFKFDNLPEKHFRGDLLAEKDIIYKIKNNIVETYVDRDIPYIRDFHNTVVVTVPGDSSCLWVLDKDRNELPFYASELLKSSISYSDVNKLVKSDIPIKPPEEIFGAEPPHDWCYFFEKASLARQLKNWDKLFQLKKEVIQKNLKPKDPNEWLVFEDNIR